MANAVASMSKHLNTAKVSGKAAASFLSASNNKVDQQVLNVHLQESSEALDKQAMATSTLALETKLLELEQHAAAEKEFMANAVASMSKHLNTAKVSGKAAASFLSASNKADQQ